MPIIQGVNFEERELEFFAKKSQRDVADLEVYLSQQSEQSVAVFKRTIQQLLESESVEQPVQQPVVDNGQDNDPPAQPYTPPVSENTEQRQSYTEPAQEPAPVPLYQRQSIDNPGNNKFKELVQKTQDALFVALAKAKTVANNFGDRWLGGKNRPPINTQPFSFNPFKESVFNLFRTPVVLGLGYWRLQGVVNSSSSGIQSVLDKTNAFSVWASLSAIQVAAMLLFLELMSDVGAITEKIKKQEWAVAGQKMMRDMVQNALYFFAIYEFNKPRQILMITLGNIFIVEKFLEEKFFQDSFATHARRWRIRAELPILVIMSLTLSTNKTLSDVSLANASKFTAQDLVEVSTTRVKEAEMDLDPEQITAIHDHPMKLSTGEYLYIVETAEKQTLLNDTGEKTFRVVTEYPITGKDDFALMSLRYYKLKEYIVPANASKILETFGSIDAYNNTLVVKADWSMGRKKRK